MPTVKRRGAGWQATYRAPDGRERTRTFPKKFEADAWVTEQVAAANRGEWIDPRAGRITFGEYAEAWRIAQVHRPSTERHVRSNLRRHILPVFGARPLASIRPTEVQAWVRKLESELSPATVAVVYSYLASILRAAVTDRVLASSPCVKIKLPKEQPKKIQPLPTEIVERVAGAVPDRYRAFVILLAGTGLRQGEALGLTVDRVDFLRRTLKVDRQLVLVPGAEPQFGPPKTPASNRTIPLPAVVADTLAAHLAQYPPGAEGLIFTNEAGSPVRRSAFGDIWRRSVRVAGAPAGTGCHALRHYYASLLIRHGESVKTVQERLGHRSAAETLDTYSHLWPDSEDRTRAAVDGVLGAAITGGADLTRTSPAQNAQMPRSRP